MQEQRNQNASQTSIPIQERVDDFKLRVHNGKLYERVTLLPVVVFFPIVEMVF